MVVKSTDGGNTWSTPVRINNDPPGNEQFFTWMAVDNVTGNIYTVFYDRRNYSDTRTDVYFAYSNDGGDTWVNERISASPFQSTITFLGDYIGITAHNGRVRPIWTRVVNGRFSAWTALIEIPIGLNNQNTEIPSSFALYQNYPNPFNPTTKFRFDVPKSGNSSTEHVQIKVYDLLGKEAAMIVNEDLAPGTYEYEWDASNLSSGVYFYTLKTNNFEATRKLVLNK
jgi:hypothetical protein